MKFDRNTVHTLFTLALYTAFLSIMVVLYRVVLVLIAIFS